MMEEPSLDLEDMTCLTYNDQDKSLKTKGSEITVKVAEGLMNLVLYYFFL